jgi:hypothetical protein
MLNTTNNIVAATAKKCKFGSPSMFVCSSSGKLIVLRQSTFTGDSDKVDAPQS